MSKYHRYFSVCWGAALVAVSAAPVLGADLGRGPAVSPEPYTFEQSAPFERWDGFYLGIAYGYATGWTDAASNGSAFDIKTTGNMGSVFGGYNWQFGRGLLGAEAEIGTGDVGGSENATSVDLNHFGALRARLGYLMTPDFLVYGTTGLAYADFDLKAVGSTQSETFTGYQVGAGTELKFSEPWSLRLEYLYTDLGSETLDHNGLANTYEPDFHTVRAGLSLKF